MSNPTTEELTADARWLVQAMEPASGLARLIEMDREAYRSASFLDDRMLQVPVRQEIRQWTEIAAAAGAIGRSDARWIFHIGHVGSTLVARLLGEMPGVLAIREPRILRDIAALPAEEIESHSRAVRALLSRTFAADEVALVKATSFVSEIAPALVPSGGRALFMYAAPDAYVAGILAGDNTRLELRHLAQLRTERLASRNIRLTGSEASDAHLAAAAWACEMTGMEAAAERMADRHLRWADFDAMLDDMATSLGETAAFFGFRPEPGQSEALASGPLMRRYSKALEFEYSPSLRRELIEDAAFANRRDIESALAMLERAAETSPLLDRALRRARPQACPTES